MVQLIKESNDDLQWYKINYEYESESGVTHKDEDWVKARDIKDAQVKFFKKYGDNVYISEIMDKDSALIRSSHKGSLSEARAPQVKLPKTRHTIQYN